MCTTTTTGRQTATLVRLKQIQPNGTGIGGGGVGGSTGPLLFNGVPEHVPDLTFIVEARVSPDGFIGPANTYHTHCGLKPATITSIEHLVTLLAAKTDHIQRMRIVTHAHPQAMAVRMFEGVDVFQADGPWLRGFGESDSEGLLALMPFQRHLGSWNVFSIMTNIRAANAAVLAPFGLQQGGDAGPDLSRFLISCADVVMLNSGNVTEGGGALPPAHRATLSSMLTILAQQAGAALVKGAVTQAHVAALQTVVTNMPVGSFGVNNPAINLPAMSVDLDIYKVAAAAVTAIQNGFRTKLNTVKKRFTETSFIDIRGCRAGETEDYLRAVQAFFGSSGHVPEVSGPRWFQFFGQQQTSAVLRPASNANIRTLLTSGTTAQKTRDGFDDWAKRARLDPAHKDFWSDLTAGGVVPFCQLAWRSKFPVLPQSLQTPGLTEFIALPFNTAIPRIALFFNVPAASTPSGAALATLNTFVTTKLSVWAPNLTATADTTTDKAKLKTLFQALSDINKDLGQTLVPADEPPDLSGAKITEFQTALIQFLEANQLAPVRKFMTAIKQRIDEANDPGLHYYMLQIGLPVFLFADHETMPSDVIVTVANNRLVVLDSRADTAYRQWPPLSWAESLPPANQFGTLKLSDASSTNIAMMVEQHGPGNIRVAVCPHEDYMDKIRTVR